MILNPKQQLTANDNAANVEFTRDLNNQKNEITLQTIQQG